MDPRLVLWQQFQQASAETDEKPGLESLKATTPALIQMPGNLPINGNILMANNIMPTMQSQHQANMLQQYLYSNYLQQLALQQQQQICQASSPTFPLSFSPIQATTIPQSVLTAEMNRKRKLHENRVESPKQSNLSYHHTQMRPMHTRLIKSETTTPTTSPSTEKNPEIVVPTPVQAIKFESALQQSPGVKSSNGFTQEQMHLLQQLFQYTIQTTTATTIPTRQLETTSQAPTSGLLVNFTTSSLPSTTVTTPTPIESKTIKQEYSCEPTHQETLEQFSASASSSTGNSPSLISLLTAPVLQNSSDENQEEDGQQDEDLDVVDVVGGIPGDKSTIAIRSVQRKAHIDFYRKLKSFRNRERYLKCQLCEKMIENSDNGIRTHIHLHSNAPLFVCKICQVGFKERHRIFEHLNDQHPGRNADCFEDRRDMVHLSEVLFNCFPKGNVKSRISYQDLLKKITQHANKEKLNTIECQMCNAKISAQRHSIIQHLHVHQSFRCKTCKFTCQDEDMQIQHCTKEHNVAEPKQGGEYNVCGAQDVLAGTFEQCFSAYFNNAEQEP